MKHVNWNVDHGQTINVSLASYSVSSTTKLNTSPAAKHAVITLDIVHR